MHPHCMLWEGLLAVNTNPGEEEIYGVGRFGDPPVTVSWYLVTPRS